MKFFEEGIYHIYNRGNNKQLIFFGNEDYLHFLKLCHKYISSRCNILAWCLMPNHFHFMIEVTADSLKPIQWGGNEMPAISNGFQLLQSSYAKMINARDNRTGSLFQQKTKSKLIESNEYAITTFWYIHQNPVEALVVNEMLQWEYSSYKDYCGVRNGSLCNVEYGKKILGLSNIDFANNAIKKFDKMRLKKIL